MNSKKLIISIFIFCIINTTLLSFGAEIDVLHRGDADYNITAQLPVDDLYAGDEVYLIYRLSQPKPVYGAEIHFTYDSDKLELKKVESICKTADIVEFSDTLNAEKATYLYSMVGKQDVPSASDIIKMTFMAKETGNTEVTLDSAKIILAQDNGLIYHIFDSYDLKSEIIVKTFMPEPPIKVDSNIHRGGGGSGGGGGGGSIIIKSVTDESKTTTVAEEKSEVEQTVDTVLLPENANNIFSDVDSFYWASESIYSLTSKGIINGYSDGSFKSNQTITRAELAKMLCLAFQLKNIDGKHISFTDVETNSWYYTYIDIAYQNGIISGESAEICAPKRNVLREEFAAMLGRSLDVKSFNFTSQRTNCDFNDKESISEFAVEYIDTLYRYGILSGDDDGNFRPKSNLTRAEAAVGINNALKHSKQ